MRKFFAGFRYRRRYQKIVTVILMLGVWVEADELQTPEDMFRC